MLISEIYESNQGEGRLTGTTSIFLRTSGCNLRCDFCDTPFASWNPEGDRFDDSMLLKKITEYKANHIVITGGEPMIWKELVELTHQLKQIGMHITIETAGTVYQPVACDLMSISPKLSNSKPSFERAGEWAARHEVTRQQPEIVGRLVKEYDYQLKFVVAKKSDLDEIQEYLSQFDFLELSRVMLMPEGTTTEVLAERKKWLQPLARELGFTFCPRMHIEWYGNKRGT